MELMEKASASISDGDLVDSLIHGFVSKRSVCAVEGTDISAGLNSIGH